MGQTAPQVLTPSFTLFREVIAHLDFMQVFWGGWMDGLQTCLKFVEWHRELNPRPPA